MFTPASQGSAAPPTGSASSHATPTPSPSPTPTPKVCARNAPGFPCEMRNRIKEIRGYMRHLPGSIGIVITDRNTGATWQNANAEVAYPAASTMKLAMMTDILLRSDAGSISLTSADRQAMFQALYTSDDDDANYLWNKYEDGSFLNRIQKFGMTSWTT
jgi:beta-lactamase class A